MLTQTQKDFLAKQKKEKETPTTGFDLRNKITDPKTGEVVKEQDYFIHLQGQTMVFERPPESGNLFYKSGESAGRFETDKEGKRVINTKAKHIEVKQEAQDDTAEQLKKTAAETEALRKELADIRAEKAKAEKELAAVTAMKTAKTETKTAQTTP